MPAPLDQNATPYATALAAFAAQDNLWLQVPGHSASTDAAPSLCDYYGLDLLRKDIPMHTPGVDEGPNNPLQQALDLAAAAYGAARVWFLAGGASQANRIAALALGQLGNPEHPVLLQRSAHSSLIDGAILADLNPVFLTPTIDPAHGIHHGVTATQIQAALDYDRDVKAVTVVSPSYFGAVADIPAIANLCHDRGIPLIVDAAWGAHFGFHPSVPAHPISQGADLVISSTHKQGGALTQAAMLHLADGPYRDRLEPLLDRAVTLTSSTSTSSLLLASLDLARHDLAVHPERIAASAHLGDQLRDLVRAHPRLAVVSDGFTQFADITAVDPTRVSIDVTGLGVSGHTVRRKLATEQHIHLEIATDTAVVAFFGPGYVADLDRLLTALDALADPNGPTTTAPVLVPEPGPARMNPRAAYLSPTMLVPFSEAAGHISADSLAAYPPGIPNLLPGELITSEQLTYLRDVLDRGGYVRGAATPGLSHIRVVA